MVALHKSYEPKIYDFFRGTTDTFVALMGLSRIPDADEEEAEKDKDGGDGAGGDGSGDNTDGDDPGKPSEAEQLL
jgi:hypothetical protein